MEGVDEFPNIKKMLMETTVWWRVNEHQLQVQETGYCVALSLKDAGQDRVPWVIHRKGHPLENVPVHLFLIPGDRGTAKGEEWKEKVGDASFQEAASDGLLDDAIYINVVWPEDSVERIANVATRSDVTLFTKLRFRSEALTHGGSQYVYEPPKWDTDQARQIPVLELDIHVSPAPVTTYVVENKRLEARLRRIQKTLNGLKELKDGIRIRWW
jgi:hypothetical protein